MVIFGYNVRLKHQWWWFEVRKGAIHERTYLKRSDAIGFAELSQKIRGGSWSVRRHTSQGYRVVALYNGERRE